MTKTQTPADLESENPVATDEELTTESEPVLTRKEKFVAALKIIGLVGGSAGLALAVNSAATLGTTAALDHFAGKDKALDPEENYLALDVVPESEIVDAELVTDEPTK